MANRQFKFVVVATAGTDNRGKVSDEDGLTAEYEIKSTNALRAANKVRQMHAEACDVEKTAVQILDAYRPE